MKLKHILPAIVALLSVAFVSCSEGNEEVHLKEIQASTSYVAISTLGGTSQTTITATDSWTITESSVPSWLTISPMSGSAGETTLSFSADETLDGRTAEIQVVCGDQTQIINVIQGLATVTQATCAEVIAGPDSKTYLVTGTVTAIANTTYGNFYLNDGTGEIYIYGTVNSSGSYAWSSFNIEVGDEVTVQGPKTTYNGTVELVDATFISVNKSLISIESAYVQGSEETTVVPKEGAIYQVNVTCKGNGVSLDIPDDLKSWISIASIQSSSDGAIVLLNIAANEAGDREATLTFTTTDGIKTYTAETTITQEGSIIEATVAEILAAEEGSTVYRLTGIITGTNSYANNIYVQDWSGNIYSYRTDNCTGVANIGDVIRMTGKRSSYNGVAQISGGTIEEVLASPTAATPAEFVAAEDGDALYVVDAVVQTIKNTTYGNMVMQSADGTVTFETYGCYGVYGDTSSAVRGFVGNNVKVGDTLKIVGAKSTYNGTVQMKNAYCVGITSAE